MTAAALEKNAPSPDKWLDNAEAALKSVEYTATGYDFALGQAVNPSSPWPKFLNKSYTRLVNFETPGKVTGYPILRDDVVVMRSSGGGGYGDPLKREPELVANDARRGIVSSLRECLVFARAPRWRAPTRGPPRCAAAHRRAAACPGAPAVDGLLSDVFRFGERVERRGRAAAECKESRFIEPHGDRSAEVRGRDVAAQEDGGRAAPHFDAEAERNAFRRRPAVVGSRIEDHAHPR